MDLIMQKKAQLFDVMYKDTPADESGENQAEAPEPKEDDDEEEEEEEHGQEAGAEEEEDDEAEEEVDNVNPLNPSESKDDVVFDLHPNFPA